MALNSYELSRNWFNYCFDHPDEISPAHTAIYFFAIEHCNRLGWKERFGFPTTMAMEATGIKKHHTFIKYFHDLVEWGFFELVEKSRNQYSSNIISLKNAMPKNGKAHGKALDRAMAKHAAEQGQSTGCIIKPKNNEPKNKVTTAAAEIAETEATQNPAPIGSDMTIQVAKQVWEDQIWREQVCMGNSLNQDTLFRWMAKFNASIMNDTMPDFSPSRYKKLFGGWLSTQVAKGYKLPETTPLPSTGAAPLKKLA